MMYLGFGFTYLVGFLKLAAVVLVCAACIKYLRSK